MAVVGPSHTFLLPKREVLSMGDMDKWARSEAYREYVGFLEALNSSVRGKPLSHPLKPSPVLNQLVAFLENVDLILDDTPLIDQPQRFGNKAFAKFYERVKEEEGAKKLLTAALPAALHPAVQELAVYFTESLGNATRVDYGSGHELSFVMFLYGLFRVGALDCHSEDDKIGAVTLLFNRYLALVRKVQMKYNMEPAGSHGVWSLDDFQFVPFIWGSSQFVGNPMIEPSQFADKAVVDRLHSEYMFLGCIDHIWKVKTGPFHEHSNQLYNISGTRTWKKVNEGLIKMYKGEVLAKFPVVQHILFGSLLSIQEFEEGNKQEQKKALPLPPKFP